MQLLSARGGTEAQMAPHAPWGACEFPDRSRVGGPPPLDLLDHAPMGGHGLGTSGPSPQPQFPHVCSGQPGVSRACLSLLLASQTCVPGAGRGLVLLQCGAWAPGEASCSEQADARSSHPGPWGGGTLVPSRAGAGGSSSAPLRQAPLPGQGQGLAGTETGTPGTLSVSPCACRCPALCLEPVPRPCVWSQTTSV